MAQILKKHKIIKLKEVDSTNLYANKLPAETEEGTVVLAEFQAKGRGQGSNFWESSEGKNLTFSIILKPSFIKVYEQFYLSKIISLAVSDFISLYTQNVSVKWPNDIYIGDKKVAGILIENAIERDFIKTSIIGLGININQEAFMSEAPNPVSIKQQTGDDYDLSEMLDVFLNIFDYRYEMLKEQDFTTIDENYTDILYRKGISAVFYAEGERFTGIINGVEETGELLITDNSGKTRKFLHKEVEFDL